MGEWVVLAEGVRVKRSRKSGIGNRCPFAFM